MLVNINMKNTKSKIDVTSIDNTTMNAICEKLSYVKTGFGASNPRKYMINPRTGITFTGLIPYVIDILRKNGYQYKINDMRVTPVKKFNWTVHFPFPLRDYQQRIINAAVAKKRFVCMACTSAGKSLTMAHIIAKFGVKTIVIAPKASLSIQLQKEFTKFFNMPIGLVNGAVFDVQDITIATPQTLKNHPEVVKQAEALFIDEFHNEPSDTIVSIAAMADSAYYRVGVSGSPWRDDGTDIIMDAYFAPRNPKDVIMSSELIRKGILTPVSITIKNMESGCGWLGSYDKTYDAAIVNNKKRNDDIITTAVDEIGKGHPTLILITKINHGYKLLNMLKDKVENKSYNVTYDNKNYTVHTVEIVTGSDDMNRREAIFQAIRDGKCMCMIASTIADEGLDIVPLQTLILANGGIATTRLFQRIGRVIRKYEKKKTAYVYDYRDSNPTMYEHAMVRYQLMKMEPAWQIKIV